MAAEVERAPTDPEPARPQHAEPEGKLNNSYTGLSAPYATTPAQQQGFRRSRVSATKKIFSDLEILLLVFTTNDIESLIY